MMEQTTFKSLGEFVLACKKAAEGVPDERLGERLPEPEPFTECEMQKLERIAEKGPGSNTGHGHVWHRPDGLVARCGGPAICEGCYYDALMFGDGSAKTQGVVHAKKNRGA